MFRYEFNYKLFIQYQIYIACVCDPIKLCIVTKNVKKYCGLLVSILEINKCSLIAMINLDIFLDS